MDIDVIFYVVCDFAGEKKVDVDFLKLVLIWLVPLSCAMRFPSHYGGTPAGPTKPLPPIDTRSEFACYQITVTITRVNTKKLRYIRDKRMNQRYNPTAAHKTGLFG